MRLSRIAGPGRLARDEHRPLAGAPAADPGALASALKSGSPPVGDHFGRPGADPADRGLPLCRHPPASLLQPGAHDHQRDGRTGSNRPVGHDRRHLRCRRLLPRHRRALTGVRASARALLAVAGTAGVGIAASPEPARGATPRHLAWTVLGAVTIAVWPAFAAKRAAPRPLILSGYGSAAITPVFVALLGWTLAETRDGSVLGLAERLTTSIQTCWPFITALALRPRPGLTVAVARSDTAKDGVTARGRARGRSQDGHRVDDKQAQPAAAPRTDQVGRDLTPRAVRYRRFSERTVVQPNEH